MKKTTQIDMAYNGLEVEVIAYEVNIKGQLTAYQEQGEVGLKRSHINIAKRARAEFNKLRKEAV